jgi:hypothetical protein
MKPVLPIFILTVCLGKSLSAADGDPVDFAHQIVPVLKQHCVECHGGDKSKGGFSLNTRRLFLEDESAIPGNAAESYFLELIEDPDPEYRMPQDDNPAVPEDEVALLKRWVDQGMVWEPGFTFGEPTYEPPLRPRTPPLPHAVDGRVHPVDRIIDAYLAEGNHPRPDPIEDAVFLRRVSLDLVGLLPTSEQTQTFLADRSVDKRDRLVDDLLQRDIDYTEHWLTFWNDLLRNDYDGTGFITGGRTQISNWLYDALKENKPFDLMVRELIAPPDEASAGFINGIQWRGEVSAGQSLPIQFSQNISQSFLGINMKCASCHDSFVDRWSLAEAYGLAAIYSEAPMELYRCDKPTGVMARAAWLFPEIGQVDPGAGKEKRLEQLADLFVHPENGRVPRTLVNRLWGQLMGRGIVHPLDAMGTEPWNADLLDWLAADFQEHGFDLKRTLQLITTSQAYQSRVVTDVSEGDGDAYVYRGPVPKRLSAEQFVDAMWQISGRASASMDAPIVRRTIPDGLEEELAVSTSWIWGPSVDNGLPPHGEAILVRREIKPAKPVLFAGIVAAADNAFELFLNGEPIFSGTGWKDLKVGAITSRLREAGNEILISAENRGSQPNAAGIFCAIRLEYEDGTHEVITTDEQWLASQTMPEGESPEDWDLESIAWVNARMVSDNNWEKATNANTGNALAKVYVGREHPVRASLVKTDSLMRALGRPNRDQVVTSRPNELTTLEAVNLSTSSQLIDHLRTGAKRFLQNSESDTAVLADEIYLALLTRYPNKSEKRLLLRILGRQPDVDTVTDLLWALVVTPDFFIIH